MLRMSAFLSYHLCDYRFQFRCSFKIGLRRAELESSKVNFGRVKAGGVRPPFEDESEEVPESLSTEFQGVEREGIGGRALVREQARLDGKFASPKGFFEVKACAEVLHDSIVWRHAHASLQLSVRPPGESERVIDAVHQMQVYVPACRDA